MFSATTVFPWDNTVREPLTLAFRAELGYIHTEGTFAITAASTPAESLLHNTPIFIH